MNSNLTLQQQKILRLVSIGLAAKEIAEETGAATNTVNTHVKNIKERLGLQKSSELTAYYWCEFFGTSFKEQRKNILSTCTSLLILFSLSFEHSDKRIIRFRFRKEKIELVNIHHTI